MAADPLQLSFWRDEERALWEAIEPLATQAVLAGAAGAARIIPPEMAELVNWDFVNRSALQYLQRYRLDAVTGINETTRRATIDKIRQWMHGDQGIDALKRDLRPLFGRTRADSVGVTEVTRLFAKGNATLWHSTGVVGAVRWRTAVDDRVCPLCRPLEGKLIPMGGSVQVGREEMARAVRDIGLAHDPADIARKVDQLVKWHGTGVELPPRHVNCRCWTQPVVDEGMFRREIGDILASDFFAKVESGQYPEVYVAWQR